LATEVLHACIHVNNVLHSPVTVVPKNRDVPFLEGVGLMIVSISEQTYTDTGNNPADPVRSTTPNQLDTKMTILLRGGSCDGQSKRESDDCILVGRYLGGKRERYIRSTEIDPASGYTIFVHGEIKGT